MDSNILEAAFPFHHMALDMSELPGFYLIFFFQSTFEVDSLLGNGLFDDYEMGMFRPPPLGSINTCLE